MQCGYGVRVNHCHCTDHQFAPTNVVHIMYSLHYIYGHIFTLYIVVSLTNAVSVRPYTIKICQFDI